MPAVPLLILKLGVKIGVFGWKAAKPVRHWLVQFTFATNVPRVVPSAAST